MDIMKNSKRIDRKIKFIGTNDIKTYYDHEMSWVDATRFENISPESAWLSITPLFLERFTELSTISTQPVEIHKIQGDAPLLTKGNSITARAQFFKLFTIPMQLEILEVRSVKYLRLGVTVLGLHLADIDFHIKSEHGGTRMSYRQGFRTHSNLLGWIGGNISFNKLEKPEAAEIYNLWLKIIYGVN